MTAIILQARIDSARLPGKALLLLDGKPIIYRVMEALNNVPADLRILACPEDSTAAFSSIAEKAGFKIHSGPKEDVLERFCQAIRRFNLKRIIRATGDNPFVFTDAAAAINNEAVTLNADYAGFAGLPYGAGVESVCAAALLGATSDSANPYEREHVCPFLYNHGNLYKLHRPVAPEEWHAPDLRLTIDTRNDYERAVKLFDILKNEPDRYNGEIIIHRAKAIL